MPQILRTISVPNFTKTGVNFLKKKKIITKNLTNVCIKKNLTNVCQKTIQMLSKKKKKKRKKRYETVDRD